MSRKFADFYIEIYDKAMEGIRPMAVVTGGVLMVMAVVAVYLNYLEASPISMYLRCAFCFAFGAVLAWFNLKAMRAARKEKNKNDRTP